jgi:hypothetical protein
VAHTLRTSHAIPALTDYLAEYLQRQMASGVIDTADPLLSAEAFLGSLIAQARYRLSIGVEGDSPDRLEARLRYCVEVFARGFGHRAIGGRQGVNAANAANAANAGNAAKAGNAANAARSV